MAEPLERKWQSFTSHFNIRARHGFALFGIGLGLTFIVSLWRLAF
jgi:hypothetical protein